MNVRRVASADDGDDRVAPHDIDAEQAVLGAVLIADTEALEVVTRLLRPESFFRPAHQRIFACILALAAVGKPADLVIVSSSLESLGELDGVGGAAYLAELMAHTPVAHYVEHYAMIVLDAARRRDTIAACGHIARTAWNTADPRDAATVIAEAVERFNELDNGLELTETGDIAVPFARLQEPRPDGYTTGVPRIDEWLGGAGIYPGRMYVVSGPTGQGKTWFLNGLTLSVLAQGARVLDFSLEMSAEERVIRLGANIVGAGAFRLLHDPRRWTAEDCDNFDTIHATLAPYQASGALRIFERQRDLTKMNALVRVHDPDVVMIDYYQNLAKPRKARDKWEADELNAAAIESAAARSQAAYVIASQLNSESTRAARAGDNGDATGMRFGQALAHKCDADLRLSTVKGEDGSPPLTKIAPVKNRFGHDADRIAAENADLMLFGFDKETGAIRPAYAGRDAAVPGMRLV